MQKNYLLLISSEKFINKVDYYIIIMGYKYKEKLESLVNALFKVNDYLEKENPDLIIAPLRGAVPFIDILNIINEDFPNEKVEYVIASSCVDDLRTSLRKSLFTLIAEKIPEGGTAVFIDEVVSGNSLVRLYKQFNAALNEYVERRIVSLYGKEIDMTRREIKNYKQEFLQQFKVRHIGLVEEKPKKKNKEYQKLLEEEIIIPFEVIHIPTRDRPKYCIIQYEENQLKNDRVAYLPRIKEVKVSQDYLGLLEDVARIIGKDPESVEIHNIGKILRANKLPQLYDELYDEIRRNL